MFVSSVNMFSAALFLLLAAGCVKCEQLTQPASVTVQPGQRLTISCQVSYSVSSYATAWIRQPAGKGLEWIGWRYTGGSNYKDSLKNKFSIDLDSSSNTVTLNGQNMQPEDSAVYYCARYLRAGGYVFDYWGDGTKVTVLPVGSSKIPTLFVLSPQQPQGFPLKTADQLGPHVCLASFSTKGGNMTVNVDGGSVTASTEDAVLSTKSSTYYSAAFSNKTIHSCQMNGTLSNNEADDACGNIYPEKAKLNFYLLVMNGVRVVFTKALAFSTVLTIRAWIF